MDANGAQESGCVPEQLGFRVEGSGFIVPLKLIEYGFGYSRIRSPYTPYPMCSRGTKGASKGILKLGGAILKPLNFKKLKPQGKIGFMV